MKTTPLRDELATVSGYTPRISIVIPAYNVEAYIRAAIQSTLAQTAPAYEIIIIDDGSTDSTRAVLAEFEGHPSVRLYRQSNHGPGPTRNRGASLAGGDYLYFFDADDLLDERFVECIQSEIARAHGPDVVLFSGQSFTEDPKLSRYVKSYARRATGSGLDSVQAISQLLEKRDWIHAPAWLYVVSRPFWHDAELAYPDIIYEDENVIMPLLLAASRINITDDVLFYRRLRAGSIMTRVRTRAHAVGRKSNLIHAIKMIECRPSADRTVKRLLRRRCRSMAKAYLHELDALGQPVEAGLLARAALKTRRRELLWECVKRMFMPKGRGPKVPSAVHDD